MTGWQPDVVCDNTHAQQITVHLRSIRPRKLARVTRTFFFRRSHRKNTTIWLLRFLFLKQATRTHTRARQYSRRLRTTTGRRTRYCSCGGDGWVTGQPNIIYNAQKLFGKTDHFPFGRITIYSFSWQPLSSLSFSTKSNSLT